MAFVEGSHCGHETDGPVIVELFAAPLAEMRDLAEDLDGSAGYDLILLLMREELGA
jgi:hypothetical protein